MDDNNETRFLADISHELRKYTDTVRSCAKLISGDCGGTAACEYAGRIEAAADEMNAVIDTLLDKAADLGDPGTQGNACVDMTSASDADTPLVLIVDDDELVSGTASDILGKVFRTETAYGGAEALAKLGECRPSLILLDVNMPDMDGFETLARIRRSSGRSPIPVIFLTGDEDRDIEIRCLKAGASDFVRKPLVSEVLVERVRRIIELDRLQHFLHSEVAAQTKRSVHLSKEIMLALSKAVDAKDHYTNGHSQRVAAYSAEIARRMGKSASEQEDIYAMGLLHDVGKIGVSEAIINKTSRLDDNEYTQIKEHTTIGHGILKIITEIPGLAIGARWHHERYDGRGYPDGLSGTDIPEEARIICVADCYDAMTSNRSYSTVREQSAVRAEILRCRGTQFDPDVADIMIAMIDDDPEYRMSEREGHDAAVPQMTQTSAAKRPGASGGKPAPAGKPVIPAISGLDLEYARKNIADDEILAVTLRRFFELMPSKAEKLAACYETAVNGGSPDAYRIEVHSMKSGAATVGLTELSETARVLEHMAKAGDIGGIRSLHGRFAEEWESACRRLAAGYAEDMTEANSTAAPDGTGVLPELLAMLRLHMEDMDIDAADGIIKLIGSYSYSPAVQPLTDALGTAVLALDEDKVSEISERIAKEIKQ